MKDVKSWYLQLGDRFMKYKGVLGVGDGVAEKDGIPTREAPREGEI